MQFNLWCSQTSFAKQAQLNYIFRVCIDIYQCRGITTHDDVIKWKHFPRCWPFVCRPVTGALMFPSICAWINGCTNNREAGDMRRHRAHYDVSVMSSPGYYLKQSNGFHSRQWQPTFEPWRRYTHYNDVIMSAMASQITGVSIVCSTVGSGKNQRKQQSFASLAFVRRIHRWPVNSPHKRSVTQKIFPFDDIIRYWNAFVITDRSRLRYEIFDIGFLF